MNLKTWQKLELIGNTSVLLALFLQLFGALNIEGNLRQTDKLILEERLSQIREHIVDGEVDEFRPPWEEIEEYYAGPKNSGDAQFRSVEVFFFLKIFSAALFFVGAILSLLGKYLQYDNENQVEN